MHLAWIYVISLACFLAFIWFYAYINNIEPSSFFQNKLWWAVFILTPLLFIYEAWRYPGAGYESVFKLAPLASGLGMLILSISILSGWFQWDPKYSKSMPFVEKVHQNKPLLRKFLFTGIFLVSTHFGLEFLWNQLSS